MGVATPVETYYGSFNYMPRLNGTKIGGTNGVYAMSIYLTGEMTVYVRSPNDGKLVEVAKGSIASNHPFPDVRKDMQDAISKGRSAPGLDAILDALVRKGALDKIRTAPDGITELVGFPFLGDETFNRLY
ncbi:MAG: hypothetical protein EOP06_11550 [Proteobacteria bacterium]|nr:MAG: hypothetical protein EOP06_11550 [Pseudomonadota bacterium]